MIVARTCAIYHYRSWITDWHSHPTRWFYFTVKVVQFFRAVGSNGALYTVLKRNKKIVYLDDYTIFNEKIGKTNEEAMIEKESVSCMVELIRNMKSPYKEVLYLKYYNEMNLREIAEDLQMNYDNVRQILVRGRKKLKEKMKESGYFYEDESDI